MHNCYWGEADSPEDAREAVLESIVNFGGDNHLYSFGDSIGNGRIWEAQT